MYLSLFDVLFLLSTMTNMIHGTGIFTYMKTINIKEDGLKGQWLGKVGVLNILYVHKIIGKSWSKIDVQILLQMDWNHQTWYK